MTSDSELKEAIRFHNQHYGDKEVPKSVFETFLCGHFHTYPRAAREIMELMSEKELVVVKKGMVHIN